MKSLTSITNKLTAHYEKTLSEHGDSERGHDWQENSELRRFEVMQGIFNSEGDFFNKDYTVLDYGCGTGRMVDHLWTFEYSYTGADNSLKMISKAVDKYPGVKFINGNILEHPNRFETYDYVYVNGVFTQKLDVNDLEFARYWESIIKALWNITNIGLAVNFMSNVVDEKRDNLCHLSMEAVLWFAWKHLGTRNVVFRNDYGLFEYTAYIYKDER